MCFWYFSSARCNLGEVVLNSDPMLGGSAAGLYVIEPSLPGYSAIAGCVLGGQNIVSS
jgi:hypothetical protein